MEILLWVGISWKLARGSFRHDAIFNWILSHLFCVVVTECLTYNAYQEELFWLMVSDHSVMISWSRVLWQNSMVSGVCGRGTFGNRGGRKWKGIQEESVSSYIPHRPCLSDLHPPTWLHFLPLHHSPVMPSYLIKYIIYSLGQSSCDIIVSGNSTIDTPPHTHTQRNLLF